jgi:uncharacterized membrane protein YcaP (DUF421 family)
VASLPGVARDLSVRDVDSPVQPFDPRRLLIGKTPPLFLLEIVVRAIFVYVVLLVAIRLMGKRVAGQLSLSELAVIVTLGAAIGVPIEVPEHGMLPAAIVLAVAIAYQRVIGFLSFRSRRMELLTQGDLTVLMRDGVLNLPAMRKSGLSRERVYAALRERGIEHLGEVRRMYFETSGAFSIYPANNPRPGLSIVPPEHPGLERQRDLVACVSCGTVLEQSRRSGKCPSCGAQSWGDVILAGDRQ